MDTPSTLIAGATTTSDIKGIDTNDSNDSNDTNDILIRRVRAAPASLLWKASHHIHLLHLPLRMVPLLVHQSMHHHASMHHRMVNIHDLRSLPHPPNHPRHSHHQQLTHHPPHRLRCLRHSLMSIVTLCMHHLVLWVHHPLMVQGGVQHQARLHHHMNMQQHLLVMAWHHHCIHPWLVVHHL